MGRRPIPEDQKKKSADYPQLAFRVAKEDKSLLLEQIEAIQYILNKRRSDADVFVTKGDVAVQALKLGLEALKKHRR